MRLPEMTREGRVNAAIGGLVTLAALSVYAWCVTPTVPYWDSGEFIATSHILGIPHPPGTPLYVLIGRLVSLLPLGSIAVRVNLLSSFSAAIGVLLTYLITVRIIRRLQGTASPAWLAWAGGVVAAFFTAWCPTYWDNGIEAEVYSTAIVIMNLCVWLALVWWERQGQPRNDRFLWLILYVLFLGIGVHLGAFLVFPCIYLLVTMVHWDRVRKGGFWGSILLFATVAVIRFAIISSINDQDPRITELSMAPQGIRNTESFLTLILGLAVVWNLISVLGPRFALGIVGLAAMGVSVHLYLYIRAHLHPAINEADPGTWDALKLVLVRDQYKPPEPIFRKASLWYQFNWMYLRYFQWQYHLAAIGKLKTYLLPVAVGVFGAVTNHKERKSFWLVMTLFLITGPFLVWYLNFKEGEVRERDYFFVSNFNYFAIWIGIGTAALVQALSDALVKVRTAGNRLHPAAVGLAAVLVFSSVMPLFAGEDNQNFFRHNRRGNFIAHDYAYDILVGLEPNAVIFTNGDNDTFPLWYMQEVENFRKDVRVLCLSLLNTDWCIRQARDQAPRVPITLTDAEIEGLTPYRDRSGRIMMVKDIMVKHIIEANQWKRPLYLAITVPDQMGLERQLSMEGLVYRICKDPVAERLDSKKTWDNMHNKYLYRGFLTRSGDWDTAVYKDEQSTRLLQNFAAAEVQLALQLAQEGKNDQALEAMDRTRRMSSQFPSVLLAMGYVYERIGRLDLAQTHYQGMLKTDPNDARVLGALGRIEGLNGDTTSAITHLRKAIDLDPSGDFNYYADLVNIIFVRGDRDGAIQAMQAWLRQHPDDQRAQESLKQIRSAPAFISGPPARPPGGGPGPR